MGLMKLCRPRVIAGLAPAVLATCAWAAEESHGHEELGAIPSVNQGLITGLTSLIVFFIVFAVLAVKVWPTISRALDERNNKIKSEIEQAEAARAQAREALEEYERSLSQARAEAQKMLDETKAQQAKLAAELKAKADAELGQMRERAMRDIDAAKRAALSEIYAEAATLATAVAGKVLGREISGADQTRLVEESLRELRTVRSN